MSQMLKFFLRAFALLVLTFVLIVVNHWGRRTTASFGVNWDGGALHIIDLSVVLLPALIVDETASHC